MCESAGESNLKKMLSPFLIIPFVKLTFAIVLVLSIDLKANAQDQDSVHHCLNEKKSVSFGVGYTYLYPHQLSGVNGRFYYNFSEHLCAGPEFTYAANVELKTVELNLVGHYIFDVRHFGVYPSAGLSFSQETEIEKSYFLNPIFGAGIHRNFKFFTVLAETNFKLNKSGFQYNAISGSILFTIHYYKYELH